jgi:hypothetical protein
MLWQDEPQGKGFLSRSQGRVLHLAEIEIKLQGGDLTVCLQMQYLVSYLTFHTYYIKQESNCNKVF